MAISPQRLTIYLYSAHRAVIFAIAQLSCLQTRLLLFGRLDCAYHVLEELLPPKSDSQHNLPKRRHNITLPEKKGHLAAKNFIISLLYKDTY